MIPISSSARIWIATGYTDMRKGMQGLSLLVQERLGRDPFAGDIFVFRGRSGGSLIKALWHDGIGLSLYAKRLDRGRWQSTGATRSTHGDHRAPARLKKKFWGAKKDAANRPFCDSIRAMGDGLESLPDDIKTLKAALIVARAEAAAARARQSDDQALVAHLKLQIEKLNRDRYGPHGAYCAAIGSVRTDAGGTGEFGDGGRTRRRNGRWPKTT